MDLQHSFRGAARTSRFEVIDLIRVNVRDIVVLSIYAYRTTVGQPWRGHRLPTFLEILDGLRFLHRLGVDDFFHKPSCCFPFI